MDTGRSRRKMWLDVKFISDPKPEII